MQVLKQSTTATILVGPVLDSDGAAYTSAVIGDFNITKNGSTAALAASATATHSHNGMYLIALTTGNTDTVGRLDVSMNNASYAMTNHRYEVLTADQFDALITNGTVTPADIASAVLSASSGTGARTVTITVNDGTNVLQNARVRLTNGAETYTGLTNASGVVVFNVDDNDWIVSITKAGYSYSGTTLTVNGTETATYSMTLISLTASDVDKVTGYWTVLDAEGNEASGVVVTVKARQASRGSAGALHNAATRTATSAANGLVQFTNMIPGWRYSVVANDEYVADFTVPADAVTSVELGSIVARLT